ncbi:MAG: phosphatase PAP2 family protein [Candidatus Binataceae bacterium]
MSVSLRVALVVLFLLATSGSALAQAPRLARVGGEVGRDARYLTDNVQLDPEDIVTAPPQAAGPGRFLRSRRFYLELAGAGVLWDGSFALGKSMQSGVGHMAHGAHDLMENLSYVSLVSAEGLLYADGLYRDDRRAREYTLTGTEAAGMGVLLNLGIKAIFGRPRPFQSRSHTAFFRKAGNFNASSFTSNDMIITSAMATGVSEHFDNRWFVALPLYSLVATEGFTRMGSDQNWLSDVVAGGLLGWATAELLLRLHAQHALVPDRWRIVPISPPPRRPSALGLPPDGYCVKYSW